MASRKSDGKLYGTGDHISNPFFPGESMFVGPHQTLVSPHGSALDATITDGTALDELKGQGRKLPGSHSQDETASAKPAKRQGGR